MAKGRWVTKSERKKIKSLLKTGGKVSDVARLVNRDPAVVRRLTKPKPNPNLFNWKDFNNSVIL